MRRTKVPEQAFEYYFSLGSERSYGAVARKFGVARKTVNRHAISEGWQSRALELERRARDRAEEKAVESLEEMNERHMKVARAIQARALEALRRLPLSTCMEAVRALEIGVKQERLVRGEPTDRNAVDVETIIRREYDRWLVRSDDSNAAN